MNNVNISQVANFTFTMINPLKTIEFYIQEFSGLGVSLNTIEQPYQGITAKRAGATLTYNEIQLTVLLDEEMQAFEEAYNYMLATSNVETNEIDWQHTFTGILKPTNNKNWFIKKFELMDCWISSISDLNFSTNQTENAPITIPITIMFDYYTMSAAS